MHVFWAGIEVTHLCSYKSARRAIISFVRSVITSFKVSAMRSILKLASITFHNNYLQNIFRHFYSEVGPLREVDDQNDHQALFQPRCCRTAWLSGSLIRSERLRIAHSNISMYILDVSHWDFRYMESISSEEDSTLATICPTQSTQQDCALAVYNLQKQHSGARRYCEHKFP